LLLKINENGDTLWTKTYPGIAAQSLVETEDHGFLVCLNGRDLVATFTIGLLRTDQNGSLIWTKQIELSNLWSEGRWIEKTFDGNFIISGVSRNSDPLSWNLLLLKTNDTGDTLWTRRYPGILSAAGNCVQATTDQGYVICGYTATGSGQQDVYLVKTDENGTITGMDDPKETTDYCFFPNPAVSRTTLRMQPGGNEVPLMIRMYDVFGKEVNKAPLVPGQNGYQLDISELKPGLYVAVIESEGQISVHEKLIIQR